MRAATPFWKVLARAIGAVVLVFALVIGVLAVFGEDSDTQATSVQVKGASATLDTTAPTSTVPVTAPATAPPTTAPPEAAPPDTAPPAAASSGNSRPVVAPQAQAAAPAPDPNPPPPPPPPPPAPPVLNPKVQASGAGSQVNITLIDFPSNSTISVTCGWLKEGTLLGETQTSTTTNGSGQGSAVCGPAMSGSTHGYGVANGVHSNHASL